MKKQIFVRTVALLLGICMLFLSSCGQAVEVPSANDDANGAQNAPVASGNTDNSAPEAEENTPVSDVVISELTAKVPEKGSYNEGVVLVKCENDFDASMLAELDYTSAEPLYNGSKWYTVTLPEGADTVAAVEYLVGLDTFDKVDYDFVMGLTGPKEDAEKNPNYGDQVNLGLSNIPNGWTHNGKAPGGSPDVIVAVIDTGVDYSHIDLRNNIWTNPAEIPDNGKDDDKNGYVDDVYGWDCVGNDKDPMDDNGHGTHVAGIIAAENNKVGGIGVAYNCKVMVLKAGNSSGYFNNSDIAEAIQYAYMNGASVINMSFGGSNISIAVEEALENAYNTSVLVAAAGNDGRCNALPRTCQEHMDSAPMYPAALPYVIGVMSTDKDGKHLSSFSNYDHYPYDSIEYEVYAVGEGVGSTWPSNKYACLNGTSMAAPTVAGIAALLRSYYSDREVYSTKFIQSQIVNTGDLCLDGAHTVADVQDALTKLPKPAVNLYSYTIDDSTSISSKNNGNGVIDAGETIRLYISLHNRGGVATDVNVTIDTYRSAIGNEALTDPYFTLVNTSMKISDIGTYSVRNSTEYFEIIVDSNCPNDYLTNFNIRFTYKNGMDDKDNTNYSGDGVAQFNVSNGYHLPSRITEDTTFKADKLYIVGEDVIIPEGVTVTFEAGCQIQFYDDRDYYTSPKIINYGALHILGSKYSMVSIYPSEKYKTYCCGIINYNEFKLDYADAMSLYQINTTSRAISIISNSYLRIPNQESVQINNKYNGSSEYTTNGRWGYTPDYSNCTYENNAIWMYAWHWETRATNMDGNFIINASDKCLSSDFVNNIVITYDTSSPYTESQTVYISGDNVTNNEFINIDGNVNGLSYIKISDKSSIKNNAFSKLYQDYANQVIDGYYDASGNPTVDVYGSLADASLLWPHVVSVEMFDKDGNPITTIGREEIKVRVTFNRPMDKNAGTFLTFGTIDPYGDYRIDGEYISDTVWEGTYTLKAQIENGQNFLKVNNAWAAEDPTKTVFGEYQLHEFTIDTTVAMSMNLQAVAKDNGIELTFAQDDYDTLLGYNIYRATSKDGNYVKLNPAILLPTDSTFLDENAEPGKTYWYTYTVVLTDFSESNPAGKVQATAKDTMAPSLYHTPVNQGYLNNNLVITATASDNVGIESVVLYYRAVGATEWKSLTMVKMNDKFSATVFGSELTLDGLEYYIVAYDTLNSIAKGSAETPYTVIIKDSSEISRIGDVDGDGTVTVKDALMLMQCLNGDLILTDDEFKRADLNGDEVLSSVEALRILQYINGKVTTLKM